MLGDGKNCTGFHANVISRWSALGHWGLTRGDEGYRLTSGDGEPEYVTHPSLEWPKRVSVGRRRLLRFPELSLQECVVGTFYLILNRLSIYLRWIINNELLCSTGNSAQLYDSLDRRGVLGTRIPGYIWLSPFTVHLKLRILLISYTPIQKKFLNKVWIVGMQEEKKHSLQRKQGAGVRRKETGSEGNYGHTCSFLKNHIEVWLIFSVVLSSATQQCDSVIHIKNIFSFLFFFMWFITEY